MQQSATSESLNTLGNKYWVSNLCIHFFKGNQRIIHVDFVGSQTKIENVSNYPQILNGSITYGFEGKINLKFADEYGIFGLPVHIVDDETGELHDFSFGIERNYTEILVK